MGGLKFYDTGPKLTLESQKDGPPENQRSVKGGLMKNETHCPPPTRAHTHTHTHKQQPSLDPRPHFPLHLGRPVKGASSLDSKPLRKGLESRLGG